MRLPKFIVDAIANNKTSLGDHPAFPPEEEEKFVLSIVRSCFEELSDGVEAVSIDAARSELNSAVANVIKIEEKNRQALEQLAQDVVCDIFDVPKDTVSIDTTLSTNIDSSKDRIVPDKTTDFQFDSIKDMSSLTDEVYKRRMLNALVVGASQSYAEDITRYIQELFAINPELPSLYKKLLDTNKLLVYLTKDTITDNNKTQAGRVDVYMSSAEKQPVIKAQGMFFPVLVEETIKGLLELAIAHGLPQERKRAEYVMMKADFRLAELWDTRLGYPLWKRIEKAFEKCGKDPQQLGLNFIFMHIAMLPVQDFNEFLQEVFMGTQSGMNSIRNLAEYIEENKEKDEFDDYIDTERQGYMINDDEFFSPEELLDESIIAEAMSLADIKQKWYPDIDENDFKAIIQADPTYNPEKPDKMGKFGKWLLNIYKTKALKMEDLYKATDYLSTFVKFYNKIEEKDINKYKSLQELFAVVEPFIEQPEQSTSKSDDVRRIKEGAEKVYEDDEWLIVIPHTEEASCYYGKGTQWCTAAERSQNMFDEYNDQGPLYININKQTGEKWQFHFETDSFMDARDYEVSSEPDMVGNAIGLSEGAAKYYESIGHKIYKTQEELTNMLCEVLPCFDEEAYAYADSDEERDEMLEDYECDCNHTLKEYFDNCEVKMVNEHCLLMKVFGKWSMFNIYFDNIIKNQWFDDMDLPCCNWMVVYKGGKANYLRTSGSELLFDEWLDNARRFDGRTKTAFIEKDGKWNLINEYGSLLLKNWYDYLNWADYGDRTLFKAEISGLWNFIDREEKPLLEQWCNKLGFFGNKRDQQTGEPLVYVSYGYGYDYYADRNGKLRSAI